jgi:hypothetical protein
MKLSRAKTIGLTYLIVNFGMGAAMVAQSESTQSINHTASMMTGANGQAAQTTPQKLQLLSSVMEIYKDAGLF